MSGQIKRLLAAGGYGLNGNADSVLHVEFEAFTRDGVKFLVKFTRDDVSELQSFAFGGDYHFRVSGRYTLCDFLTAVFCKILISVKIKKRDLYARRKREYG